MTDEEEFLETEELFALIDAPHKIEPSELPASPKKAWRLATEAGWDVSVWLSVGEVAPTVYKFASTESDKNPHNAGDVRYEGYTVNMYTVEAREPQAQKTGFQAFYVGRVYASGKKSPAASLDNAMVLDPVGVPRLLHANYKPVKVLRGDYETDASFKSRQLAAQAMVDAMDLLHNDGKYTELDRFMFTTTTPFEKWLSEWRSFVPQKTTKRKTADA